MRVTPIHRERGVTDCFDEYENGCESYAMASTVTASKPNTYGRVWTDVLEHTTWNSLPADIHNATSLDSFKKLLKHHLLTKASVNAPPCH